MLDVTVIQPRVDMGFLWRLFFLLYLRNSISDGCDLVKPEWVPNNSVGENLELPRSGPSPIRSRFQPRLPGAAWSRRQQNKLSSFFS